MRSLAGLRVGGVDVDELLKVGRAAARQRLNQNHFWVRDACNVIESLAKLLKDKHTELVKDRTELYYQIVAERKAHAATRAERDALLREPP
jgi:ADP-dependent phosphofructokinase/glucokinase